MGAAVVVADDEDVSMIRESLELAATATFKLDRRIRSTFSII